jgi:mRNA interferase YafQ
MRTIEQASAFKRDFKRVKASPRHNKDADALLGGILKLLVQDQTLPDKNRDHALVGNWFGYRECHLKPDLLLIYKTQDADVLRLARLGSHSELFG